MRARFARLRHAALRQSVELMPASLAAEALTRRLPRSFIVEPTNRCNHVCPLCPQPFHPRARGQLRLSDFRGLVDEIRDFAQHVNLTQLGEGLLNPELFAMVRYAEDSGLRCSVTTNGQLLDRHIAEILDSGLTRLKVTIDGADAETHERYRVGSDYERICSALEHFCAERARRGRSSPHLTILSLVFRFNEGQQADIRRWAEGIGADRVGFKAVRLGASEFGCGSEAEHAAEFLPRDPAHRHDAYSGGRLSRDFRVCPNFYEATILWNGDLVACSSGAFDGRECVGNVFRDGGLVALWRSEAHKASLRRIIRRETDHCVGCQLPCPGRWIKPSRAR